MEAKVVEMILLRKVFNLLLFLSIRTNSDKFRKFIMIIKIFDLKYRLQLVNFNPNSRTLLGAYHSTET